MAVSIGFCAWNRGNLSVRLSHDRILATPTAMSKCLLKAADMVLVDMDGRRVRGKPERDQRNRDAPGHLPQRPDVQAVVHAHPPIATGFASCGLALEEPLCSEIVMALGSIPLAPYATTGTDDVGSSINP